jgi:hypothetical protein
MARDKFGFLTDRKFDSQGRPLKLMSQPSSDAYRNNFDRVFKKRKTKREDKRNG